MGKVKQYSVPPPHISPTVAKQRWHAAKAAKKYWNSA